MKIYDKADKVINECFELLLYSYQIESEASVKGSGFIYDCLFQLYFKCHKINLNRNGSHIDSPDWIKTEKQQ